MPADGIVLVPAVAADRPRIARVRPPVGMGHFVHFNWYWLDRALADKAIRFRLVHAGTRRQLVGVIALGPHEPVDLDPRSRRRTIGETYRVGIDRRSARSGYGARAIEIAIGELGKLMPRLRAVRVAHHPANAAAAGFYEALGFRSVGEKIDGETGIRDRLLELRLTSRRRGS